MGREMVHKFCLYISVVNMGVRHYTNSQSATLYYQCWVLPRCFCLICCQMHGFFSFTEHIGSIIASMLRNCQGTQRQRLLNKFTENDHEKASPSNARSKKLLFSVHLLSFYNKKQYCIVIISI